MNEMSVPPPTTVSASAARAYGDSRHRLVAHVDRELAARSDLGRLLGSNPFSVAHLNHDNHAGFIATVLSYDAGSLLVRTLPWVYRSYHADGFSYEYFPVELRAWERAIADCLPVAEAAQIVPLYRWMRERHDVTVGEAEARAAAGPSEEAALRGPVRALLEALLRGDAREALRLAGEWMTEPARLATFYLEVVQPCLVAVGALWERGDITVAHEHLASATAGHLVLELYGRLPVRAPSLGVAVVTTAQGELHELGARMVADLLEIEGWDVCYLGANTPPGELAVLCGERRAALAAVSATMHFNLDGAARMVDAVRCQSRNTGVLVGGRAFGDDEAFWRLIGADAWAPDAASAVEAARPWARTLG